MTETPARPYTAVVARGYRDNWTAQQFAARQIAKLQEELGELARTIDLPMTISAPIQSTSIVSRMAFDTPAAWSKNINIDIPQAVEEIADILIVLDCLTAVLEEITGQPIDLQTIVEQKAMADVSRGVR